MRTILLMILLSVSNLTFSQVLTSTKNNVQLTIENDTMTINRTIRGAVNMYTDDGRNWSFDNVTKLKQRPSRIKGILKHLKFSRTLYIEYNDRLVSFKIK